jgi:hypothetical protein
MLVFVFNALAMGLVKSVLWDSCSLFPLKSNLDNDPLSRMPRMSEDQHA